MVSKRVTKPKMDAGTPPIICYVRAASIEDAQSAAHDVDYVSDDPTDTGVFPLDADPQGASLYEVTISAKPIKGPKPKVRKSKSPPARRWRGLYPGEL